MASSNIQIITPSFDFKADEIRIKEFANLTWDKNPKHQGKNPVMQGVFTQALLERLLIQNSLFPTRYSIKFSDYIYANEQLGFSINNLKEKINLSCKRGGQEVAKLEKIFFEGYQNFKEIEKNPITSDNYQITQKDLDKFYSFLEMESNNKIPTTFVSAMIPASLLELYNSRTGSYEGTNGGIKFSLHKQPKIGEFETKIYSLLKAPKPVQEGFAYKFKGICYQNNEPVLSGELLVSCPQKLNISV